MQDETNKKRYPLEARKPINRPKYKGQSVTWKRLFIGAVILCVAVSYLYGMALKGNHALQEQIAKNGIKIIMPSGKELTVRK